MSFGTSLTKSRVIKGTIYFAAIVFALYTSLLYIFIALYWMFNVKLYFTFSAMFDTLAVWILWHALTLVMVLLAIVLYSLSYFNVQKSSDYNARGYLKTLSYIVTVFVPFVLYQVDLMCTGGFYAPLTVFCVFAFPILIALAIVSSIKNKVMYALRFELIMVTIIISFLAASWIKDVKFADAERKGNLVITALQDFHDEYGIYPDSLSQLIPDYLEVLPQIKLGFFRKGAFQFTNEKGRDFYWLSISYKPWSIERIDPEDNYPGLSTSSQSDKWDWRR